MLGERFVGFCGYVYEKPPLSVPLSLPSVTTTLYVPHALAPVVATIVVALMLVTVGAQWELPGATARRDQGQALGFFLNPGP
jgi:hypothetical protein